MFPKEVARFQSKLKPALIHLVGPEKHPIKTTCGILLRPKLEIPTKTQETQVTCQACISCLADRFLRRRWK